MKLLIAVDSSEASSIAARGAAARLWPSGTTARVISVVEPLYGWSAPDIEEATLQSAEQTVQSAAEYFKNAGLETSTSVLTGDPKTVIRDEAAECHADFVVLGSHNARGVVQFLLGSVARAVARLATCSVEIVRSNPGPAPLGILLATDGSECSKAAARSVAERPWPAGTKFRILSVIEPSAPALPTSYFSPEVMEQLRGKDMQRAQAAVSSAESILFGAGIEASSTLAVPAATPKEIILSEAAEWGAGLIVVGSHGRRGVNRLLLGSVSEAVALHAKCSVELIRLSGQ
ncbi:MAG: universal stress protein [Bryobacteraceae bacterium]|jgi:nucleotide-binding universal stress UspA family protein